MKFFPNIIHVDITKKCNLQCTHCRNLTSNTKELDIKNLIIFFNKIFALENAQNRLHLIEIGGGEPLLNNQLFTLLDFLDKKVPDILITTNGTLISLEKLSGFKKYCDLRFQISLDGAKKETHELIRGKNTFLRTMESIKILKKNGFYVSIRMTISKINYSEIEDFVKLGKSLGVDEVSYRGVMPCGKALTDYQNIQIENITYKKLMSDMPILEKKHKIKIFCGDPLALVFKEKNTNQYGGCSIGICYLFIDEQGDIKPCPSINLTLDNIKNFKTPTDFKKFWINNPFYKKMRTRNFKKCRSCVYKYLCGGCRVFAYFSSGDYFGEDSHCFFVRAVPREKRLLNDK